MKELRRRRQFGVHLRACQHRSAYQIGIRRSEHESPFRVKMPHSEIQQFGCAVAEQQSVAAYTVRVGKRIDSFA